MAYEILESYGSVNVLVRADGKYGVHDTATGEIAFRYRTLEGAREIASAFAAQNAMKAVGSTTPSPCPVRLGGRIKQ
jgi:hypothetical protein